MNSERKTAERRLEQAARALVSAMKALDAAWMDRQANEVAQLLTHVRVMQGSLRARREA